MTLRTRFTTRLIIFIVILVLTAMACNVGLDQAEPAPIIVTATPEGYVDPSGMRVITATPEMTATFVPLPTPDLPPEDTITRAQRALLNGNFVGAVGQYQTILASDIDDESLRAAALYGMGQAALREGLFDQAAQAFSQFITQYPIDPRVPQAHFQRGDAYLGISAWQAAIDDFQIYLNQRPGIIDSYAYERIGDAYLVLGQPGLAFDNYVAAANGTRTIVPLVELRERIAAAYLNQGLSAEAIGQYDAILNVAQNAGYRAQIMYQAAQVELGAGQSDAAFRRLQQLISTYPTTDSAYQAMIILLNNGFIVDNRLRARISFANEDFGDAVTALNNYSTEVQVMPAESLLLLGQAYRGLGNYDAAFTTFQTIVDQYATDPLFGEALLEQGRTYFLQDDYVNAVNFYSSIASNYPELLESAEALWRAGFLLATELNDVDRALGTFDILSQNYPGTEWAQDGLEIAASIALNNGQQQRAQIFYTQLANTGTGENRARAFFWLGRLYREQGDTQAATQSFEGAKQADPDGYYSLRAADIVNGREPFQPPDEYRFQFDEGSALAEAEQWLRTTFGITQEGLLYPLSDALRSDPHMIRGNELWEVGALDDARAEYEELRESVEIDALATYQLAHYFSQKGVYRLSIEAAATLIVDSGQSTFEAPSYIARLRYPIYFNDLVLPHTQEYGLDPLLVFSLIRQESLFQGFATSFALAQGLMQIIPETGFWVAEQLDWPNYQNSDLYRPYVNVKFGTFYLAWVLDLVDDQKYAALAGYNGGPGNAQNWLSISGPDIDRFVQAITFDETELYITRIYEQYNVYRYLYGVDEASGS